MKTENTQHCKSTSHCPLRRQLLHTSIMVAGSVLALPGTSLTASAQQLLQTQRLSDSTLLVKGLDANVLITNSSDGLIMVDGGHASWFEPLHRIIAEQFTDTPHRALINTHWHREQTGSNEALGLSGTEIIAHENTRLWLSTEVRQRWSDTVFPPLPQAALPGTVILDSENMRIANHDVELHYLWNSHTDGDLAIYLPQQNTLVCGGMISNGQWPVLDWWTGGFIGGMLDSFLSLLTIPNAETLIVPAYGDLMTLNELKLQNEMYLTIFDRIHDMFNKSFSLEDVLAEKPTAEYDAAMGDPTQFITLAFNSLRGHLRDPQNYRLLNYP